MSYPARGWVNMIYSEDIGTEFGMEKCAMLIKKSRKRQMTEGIELQGLEDLEIRF